MAINLTGYNTLKLDIYSNRTGANVKIGIHDSGGTTTELTPTVNSSSTWETKTWDISGVSSANKDAIDSIILTVVDFSAATTFYIDNFYGASPTSVLKIAGVGQSVISKVSNVTNATIQKISGVTNA